MKKFAISRDDAVYEAWPDVVRTDSGKLICVFTECAHHGDRNNSRIMITESLDDGRTWSAKKAFTELTQKDNFYNNSRISKIGDNLYVVCDKVHKSEIDGSSTVYLWIGDSEGTVWSKPKETPAHGIVPDKLKRLKCGRFLLAAHFSNPKSGKLEQYLWYSDDNLTSWSERITVAADSRYHLCEASIVEMPDETLVAFMRENSSLGYGCMKTFSHDHGETWSAVAEMPIPGCHRPVVDFLSDGRLMMTYRFMQGGKGWLGQWTQNVFAAFFDVDTALAENRNEQSVRLFPIDFDRSAVSDLGYTGWVELASGRLYVVNYIVDDAPKAQIRGYEFTTDEVLLK